MSRSILRCQPLLVPVILLVLVSSLLLAANARGSDVRGTAQAASPAAGPTSAPSTTKSAVSRKPPAARIVAAGDISAPELGDQVDTGKLVQRVKPDRVLVLGDNQYSVGSLSDYQKYYDPTWGKFKDLTWPSAGNHEYYTPNATGYFDYFGKAATPKGKSYFSKNIGGWHVVSLNSNLPSDKGSPQRVWLRQDLAASTKRCTLAYWHSPRFSSGVKHGSDPAMAGFWRALYKRGAEIVLNGHEHNYERFARQSPSQERTRTGIREFVVGTGGRDFYGLGTPAPNSQVRIANHNGVLLLKLRPGSYSWRFISTDNRVLDRGGPTKCY
jgi:acid phosphatase type 7